MVGQDCTDYYDYNEWIQEARESPMPLIGMYVATASLVCSVAMAAVAMKISVDVTTAMFGNIDYLAKLSNSVFMITVMGNFLISFASMNNKEIFMNIVALGILYNELHEIACNGGKLEEIGNLTHEKLKEVVEKYWVMAETGSPQFVMARSVTSAMSGAICLTTRISFTLAILVVKSDGGLKGLDSPYRWSTVWIFMIQSIGVVVGNIAPLCRWLIAINFNCNNMFTNHHHKEFKLVETFWIQTLVAWKKTPLPSQIRGMKWKRVIGNVKILVLNLCIGVQIGIVVASKLVHLISIIITIPLFSCVYFGKRMKVDLRSESSALEAKNSSPELDRYVLQLEGEVKLPKSILKNMCHEFDQLILMGKSRQPQNLLELLRKSNNSFKGVVDCDGYQVQYCWMLPVVTLTSIAVALPGIENHTVNRLMSSVSEGLLYTSLVEESFSYKGDDLLINLKCAANVVWAGVELNCKCGVMRGPEVLAANSMSTISQTILNDYKCSTDPHADGHLFEKLSIMIADILGACLTNLPRVIIQKCYCSAIEERDKSVRRAACLLGETEEILAILKHHELPSLSGDRAAYIDDWRSYMMQKDPPALVPSSNNDIPASGSGELHINVDE
ncbi:hypothetical protein RHSIM_Rhsim04G0033400 [Rhododendron simsii]|uniref:Uncharacterized protein n=1 Tax=Rhododendron simsii TaxID=118357 RepID=A0A834HCE9_RHOSS|nr:hypothetical protein RHSIM_Rhsim04G0033400 [Rhododendron simsii]